MKKRNRAKRVSAGLAILILALVASGLVGCAAQAPTGNVVLADAARSEKPRLAALPLDRGQVPELVKGNTQFALDLYGKLFDTEKNLFYSPHSLSVALAMTYAGARGETEQQMADVLHYTLPQSQLHLAFNALDQALAGLGEGQEEEVFRLEIVDALWGQQGYTFLDAFLDTLAENYGAGLRLVDFQAEEARQRINDWASDETEGRIEELLPPGAIDGETALVLTDAVYFQAAWMQAFSEATPSAGAFALPGGRQVLVPMMEQVAPLGYAERPGVQAIELPYTGGDLSMVILLPEAAAFQEFAQGMDAGYLEDILEEIEPRQVRLTMPRFHVDAEFELGKVLVELGMVDAFGQADFSGMDGTQELFIDEIYHKASITVVETGTEATAASAVVMARKGEPPVELAVQVDRPFLFLIRDLETGAILFLGHVVNPAV